MTGQRLIDANALIKEANAEGAYGYVDVAQIANASTIEAKPVVHAHWKVVSHDGDKWVNKCTACGGYLKRGQKQTNYCPNCGAEMHSKEGVKIPVISLDKLPEIVKINDDDCKINDCDWGINVWDWIEAHGWHPDPVGEKGPKGVIEEPGVEIVGDWKEKEK